VIENKNSKVTPLKKFVKNALEMKYFILLPLIINQQNHFKMKKLSIAAALLFAFGTFTIAQTATGTTTTTDKKSSTTATTSKKTTMTKKTTSGKKATADKKGAAATPAAK
jgi:hypothetical protein